MEEKESIVLSHALINDMLWQLFQGRKGNKNKLSFDKKNSRIYGHDETFFLENPGKDATLHVISTGSDGGGSVDYGKRLLTAVRYHYPLPFRHIVFHRCKTSFDLSDKPTLVLDEEQIERMDAYGLGPLWGFFRYDGPDLRVEVENEDLRLLARALSAKHWHVNDCFEIAGYLGIHGYIAPCYATNDAHHSTTGLIYAEESEGIVYALTKEDGFAITHHRKKGKNEFFVPFGWDGELTSLHVPHQCARTAELFKRVLLAMHERIIKSARAKNERDNGSIGLAIYFDNIMDFTLTPLDYRSALNFLPGEVVEEAGELLCLADRDEGEAISQLLTKEAASPSAEKEKRLSSIFKRLSKRMVEMKREVFSIDDYEESHPHADTYCYFLGLAGIHGDDASLYEYVEVLDEFGAYTYSKLMHQVLERLIELTERKVVDAFYPLVRLAKFWDYEVVDCSKTLLQGAKLGSVPCGEEVCDKINDYCLFSASELYPFPAVAGAIYGYALIEENEGLAKEVLSYARRHYSDGKKCLFQKACSNYLGSANCESDHRIAMSDLFPVRKRQES